MFRGRNAAAAEEGGSRGEGGRGWRAKQGGFEAAVRAYGKEDAVWFAYAALSEQQEGKQGVGASVLARLGWGLLVMVSEGGEGLRCSRGMHSLVQGTGVCCRCEQRAGLTSRLSATLFVCCKLDALLRLLHSIALGRFIGYRPLLWCDKCSAAQLLA